jgi:hypothetical protein
LLSSSSSRWSATQKKLARIYQAEMVQLPSTHDSRQGEHPSTSKGMLQSDLHTSNPTLRVKVSSPWLCHIVAQIHAVYLPAGLAIAKVGETIARRVFEIPVLPTRCLHNLQEMQRATGPRSPDLAVYLTVLIP